MNIAILAVGRMKSGPESELLERYLSRARSTGAAQGISSVGIREIPESRAASAKARSADEASKLKSALPAQGFVVALDERGVETSSAEFARLVRVQLESGTRQMTFLIGGADGHGPSISELSDLRIAFGKATWPHQLVRIMLAEQIYRAVAILAGHPYHRQ